MHELVSPAVPYSVCPEHFFDLLLDQLVNTVVSSMFVTMTCFEFRGLNSARVEGGQSWSVGGNSKGTIFRLSNSNIESADRKQAVQLKSKLVVLSQGSPDNSSIFRTPGISSSVHVNAIISPF